MRVAHVSPIISPDGTGITTVVECLSREQAGAAVVRVFGARTEAWTRTGELAWTGAEVVALPLVGLRSLGWLRDLDTALREFSPDVVHLHGLWSLCGIAVRRYCLRAHVPYVVSPHGMLSEAALDNRSVKKKLAMTLYQRSVLDGAHFLHATSTMETDAIRRAYFTGRVEYLPNGVSVSNDLAFAKKEKNSYVLFLGRFAKIKALDRLIAAWATLKADHPDWSLRLVGPSGDRYIEELKAQSARLGASNVIFEPPVQGGERDHLIASASVLVLPSLSENFGLVVAEAMMLGVPVVCSRGTPWSEVEARGCGLWVNSDPKSIADALRTLMRLSDDERRAMGLKGRTWAMESFSWPSIAREMLSAYKTITRQHT